MDFIVKLLKLEDICIEIKYDSILVVVDKLTKYVYFIPCMEIFRIKQIAWINLN